MNNGIIKKIYREKDIKNIQNKINLLGSNRKFKYDAVSFLNMRVVTTILLTMILFVSSINYYLRKNVSVEKQKILCYNVSKPILPKGNHP